MGRNKEAFGLDSVVGRGTCLPTFMVTGRSYERLKLERRDFGGYGVF